MVQTFEYDVFLSHSSDDKPVVQALAERLRADGLRVWLDEWIIQPGDLISLKVEQGLEQSRTLILVMSAQAFASDWVSLERHTALFRDPTNQQRRFIPLLLDDTPIKDTLKQFKYIDWRQQEPEAYRQLLSVCRPKPTAPVNTPSNANLKTTDAAPKLSPPQEAPELPTHRTLSLGHTGGVNSVALSGDGKQALSGAADNTLRLWDLETGQCLQTLEGHTASVWSVALSGDGKQALSGSDDKTLRLWDLETGQCLQTLEGHTARVLSVALVGDGKQALSGSDDSPLRLWDLETGQCLQTLEGHTGGVWSVGQRSSPAGGLNKTDWLYSAAENGVLRLWAIDPANLPDRETLRQATARYTNAKVLLVGDSGVGKSGLSIRLTENKFESTVSTDAHWATHMKLPHDANTDEIDREIWLWDFAGQADYRLIHQLFMDETALAVLVFNPQSENPFEGLGQWDRDLARAARRSYQKLLVAGRCDRGGVMVSRSSIQQFAQERGFVDFLETSALTGRGCEELRQAIIQHIDWKAIPWTSSPRIFKLLKDEILRLRDQDVVLLRLGELKQRVEMQLPNESFTPDQLRAVVGLLTGPGVVWRLEFGDFVMLQPEWINKYAAAVIRSIRAHIGEIGVIREQEVLDGDLNYTLDYRTRAGSDQEGATEGEANPTSTLTMQRLPKAEEEIVLRAMHQTFVDHGLCARVHTPDGAELIFPSYFKRELPQDPGHPPILVTYRFNGFLNHNALQSLRRDKN